MATGAVSNTPGLRGAVFGTNGKTGEIRGLQKVACSDPQTDGYSEEHRIRRPWDV